jgi:hypothetical protein
MSRNLLNPFKDYPDHFIEASGIAKKDMKWNVDYGTYALPVGRYYLLRFPVLMAPKSISISVVEYE